MIPTFLASTLLALASEPDLYEVPLKFDIGLPPPCTQDPDCLSRDYPVCDVETGECVQCLGPEHCPEGWDCNPTHACRDACEEQTDCEDVEALCNPETGFCVQCIDATNCAPEEYCEEQGFCRPDLCDEGQTTACSSGMVVTCTADGGPGEVIDMCAEGCEVIDGMAQCVTTGGSTEGPAGTSGDEAGASDSAGNSAGSTEGATMGSPGGTNAPGGSAGAPSTDDEGCACRTGSAAGSAGGSAGAWSWWLVVGLGLARRRRHRRARAASGAVSPT
jgi:hypothetical protein